MQRQDSNTSHCRKLNQQMTASYNSSVSTLTLNFVLSGLEKHIIAMCNRRIVICTRIQSLRVVQLFKVRPC